MLSLADRGGIRQPWSLDRRTHRVHEELGDLGIASAPGAHQQQLTFLAIGKPLQRWGDVVTGESHTGQREVGGTAAPAGGRRLRVAARSARRSAALNPAPRSAGTGGRALAGRNHLKPMSTQKSTVCPGGRAAAASTRCGRHA